MYNFINRFDSNYNRFSVEYIDLKQLQVHLHYNRKLSDIILLKANASFYKWNMDVFYKPGFTCELSIPLNLRNKIKLKPTLSYKGKRYTDENRELSSQFHANLGLHYNYTQNLGAYFIFNNLTNSKEEMWEDYREVGFNGRLGIHYSF